MRGANDAKIVDVRSVAGGGTVAGVLALGAAVEAEPDGAAPADSSLTGWSFGRRVCATLATEGEATVLVAIVSWVA